MTDSARSFSVHINFDVELRKWRKKMIQCFTVLITIDMIASYLNGEFITNR